MTKQDEQQSKHDEPALEPETVKDLEAPEDEVGKVVGGCFGTHGQIPERL